MKSDTYVKFFIVIYSIMFAIGWKIFRSYQRSNRMGQGLLIMISILTLTFIGLINIDIDGGERPLGGLADVLGIVIYMGLVIVVVIAIIIWYLYQRFRK